MSTNADLFQRGVRALPVNAGTLHDNFIWMERGDPFSHGAPVTPETAELPSLYLGFFTNIAGNDAHLEQIQMYINADRTTVNG